MRGRVVGVALAAVLLSPLTAWAGSDSSAPVDPSRCGFEVLSAKVMSPAELTSGETLEPTDRDRALYCLELRGHSPAAGCLLLSASSYGVVYLAEGHPMLAVARAVGFRTADEKGLTREIWTDFAGNAVVMRTGSGDEISFLLAFEVPRAVSSVRLLVPALQDATVALEPGR